MSWPFFTGLILAMLVAGGHETDWLLLLLSLLLFLLFVAVVLCVVCCWLLLLTCEESGVSVSNSQHNTELTRLVYTLGCFAILFHCREADHWYK